MSWPCPSGSVPGGELRGNHRRPLQVVGKLQSHTKQPDPRLRGPQVPAQECGGAPKEQGQRLVVAGFREGGIW